MKKPIAMEADQTTKRKRGDGTVDELASDSATNVRNPGEKVSNEGDIATKPLREAWPENAEKAAEVEKKNGTAKSHPLTKAPRSQDTSRNGVGRCR